MTAPSPDSPLVLRPVAKGGEISVEVQGGFVRRPAPCDGIAIETAEHAFFVPADKLEEALSKLGRSTIESIPARKAGKR